MNVIIIGFGYLGLETFNALQNKITKFKKIDKTFKVIGIANSKDYIYNEDGITNSNLNKLQNLSNNQKQNSGTDSIFALIDEHKTDIMIEITSTNIINGEPGLSFIKYALNKGIHVVTPNKGPLVVAFKELTDLAKKNNCELLFEGTVGGAIPIFSLSKKCLQGDKIIKISGILNGTTNYILSKMYFEETSFEIAFKEAQERGITEKDPAYDIDGIDAACKITILANSLMNKNIKLKDVEIVGISGITQEAISLAKKSNFAIKLIGIANKNFEVGPKLVPINHPLCVHGTLNSIHIQTDFAKELTLTGYGAGKETVSSILNDIFTILNKKNI